TGALSWVVGAFVKIWPAVLLPSLLVHRKTRAFVTAIVVGADGVIAWLVWGGPGAPGQVLTYGGARGWGFESAPGSVLRLVTRDSLVYEHGALRLGAPPRVLAVVLAIALVTSIVATWIFVWRHGAPVGVAEVVVVTCSLVFSTLLSAQFMIWVMPFVAI